MWLCSGWADKWAVTWPGTVTRHRTLTHPGPWTRDTGFLFKVSALPAREQQWTARRGSHVRDQGPLTMVLHVTCYQPRPRLRVSGGLDPGQRSSRSPGHLAPAQAMNEKLLRPSGRPPDWRSNTTQLPANTSTSFSAQTHKTHLHFVACPRPSIHQTPGGAARGANTVWRVS